MYTPANQPRGRGTRSPRYLMHTSGGNYRPGGRPLTEGLATRAIGALDNRVLRFIEAADRTAAHTPETEPEPEISSAPIRIHNLRVLGSFNWTQSGTPKILIPGSPPIWRDENMPFTLRPDTEVFADRAVFVDSGAGTDQATSLLAMLAAVDECTASAAPFDWNMADVITDRNSLRNLLRWVNQSPTRKVDEFRIDMHLAGERSLVLTRWKRDTHVQALPGSFGFSYEENQTTPAPGCEDSRDAGHVRIISYDFGGLNIVVRSEVDACFSNPAAASASDAVDSVTDALSHMRVGEGTLGSLTFRRVGTLVPQKDTIELVTRSVKTVKIYTRREVFSQLYFAQTPHHIIAVHERGTFKDLRREELGTHPTLLAAADAAQPGLQKLSILLYAIQRLAIAHGREKHLTLVHHGGDHGSNLEVFERLSGSVLPPELVARFV